MTNELSRSKRQRALAFAFVACSAAAIPTAARADFDPPFAHDACGPDAGQSVPPDAGQSSYVFAEPISAPARGARFEASCSATVATHEDTSVGFTLAFGLLAWIARRRRGSASSLSAPRATKVTA